MNSSSESDVSSASSEFTSWLKPEQKPSTSAQEEHQPISKQVSSESVNENERIIDELFQKQAEINELENVMNMVRMSHDRDEGRRLDIMPDVSPSSYFFETIFVNVIIVYVVVIVVCLLFGYFYCHVYFQNYFVNAMKQIAIAGLVAYRTFQTFWA